MKETVPIFETFKASQMSETGGTTFKGLGINPIWEFG